MRIGSKLREFERKLEGKGEKQRNLRVECGVFWRILDFGNSRARGKVDL